MPDSLKDLIPDFEPIEPSAVELRARRRREARLATGAVVVAVVLAVALVVPAIRERLAGTDARPAQVTASPTGMLSAATSPLATASSGCGLSALPSSWLSALTPTRLTPITEVDLLAHDATTGRSLYARRTSPMTVSVVEPSGTERKLFDLATDEQAFGAAIEGDWAVLTVGSGDGTTVKGVFARRVTGGSLVTVAKQAADFSSGPISETPVLYHGVVYVQVGSSTLSSTTVSLLAFHLEGGQTQRRDVPRQGPSMARWGDALVWTSSTTKVPTMVSLSTLGDVEVPSQLASLSDAWWFASDGQTLVWEGNGSTGWLRAYRVGWEALREVRFPSPITNPDVSSWGRYATIFVDDRMWIVDIETGQYAPLTVSWGSAVVTGGRLASSEMANQKGGSAGLYELDLKTVPPLPACTR